MNCPSPASTKALNPFKRVKLVASRRSMQPAIFEFDMLDPFVYWASALVLFKDTIVLFLYKRLNNTP